MDLWEATQRFFSFTDANVQTATVGAILLGGLGGLIGAFSVLKKRALIGDTIGHSALPGICLAFLITGEKEPIGLLIGAIVTGLASVWAVNRLLNIPRIKPDVALGLTLTVAFGIGVLLLTHIQRSEKGNQAGLDKFLFGQSAGLMVSDVIIIAALFSVVFIITVVFYKEFFLIAFDRNFATTLGWNANVIDFGLLALTAITIAVSLQAVGVVLTSAILIIPSTAARFWTNRLSVLIFLSMLFGALSGFLGTFISFLVPKLPSGPLIVVAAATILLCSLFFAPNRGMIAKYVRSMNSRKSIACEHLLRTIWEVQESKGKKMEEEITIADIKNHRLWERNELLTAIQSAKKNNLIVQKKNAIQFTTIGKERAKRLVQIHRLWEKYLINAARFNVNHIETEADAMEHYIPEHVKIELEKEWLKEEMPESPHPIQPECK